MLNKGKTEKVFYILERLFLCLFSLYVILGSNNITYGASIISYIMWPSFLLGGVIICYRLFNYKKYIKMPGLLPLIALLFSLGISTLVNYSYSFKANVIVCIYWLFFFFVFYLVDENSSAGKTKRDAETVAFFFLLYSMIATIIGLYMMVTGVSAKIVAPDTGYEYYQGFAIGRLWGIYINPNNGAVTSAIAIFILAYFIITKKALWSRILCAISIFPELLFITLSDSRTGAVCVGCGIAVFFFIIALYKLSDKKIIYRLIAVICAGIIAIAGIAAPRELKNGYNYVVTKINEVTDNDDNMPGQDTDDEKDDIQLGIIDRGYDTSDDISNRRFDAWNGAIQLFADSPKSILLGYSYNGFTEQARNLQPNNYLVNNDFGDFTTLDNEIFNILVAQGTLGIIVFVLFVAAVLIFVSRRLMKVKKENHYITALLSAVTFSLALSAMFSSVMFYHLSPNTVLFWCFLGYLVHIMKKSGEECVNEQ